MPVLKSDSNQFETGLFEACRADVGFFQVTDDQAGQATR